MIIPGTTKLTFNISLSGTDANRTLVGNLGRNIVRKLVVKLEGNEIISSDDYDILYSYYDCWKSTAEKCRAVFQGIVEAGGQTENAIKHRINVGYKASNARVKQWHQFSTINFALYETLKSFNPASSLSVWFRQPFNI